jgi:hypothetical protein
MILNEAIQKRGGCQSQDWQPVGTVDNSLKHREVLVNFFADELVGHQPTRE